MLNRTIILNIIFLSLTSVLRSQEEKLRPAFQTISRVDNKVKEPKDIQTGVQRSAEYLPLLIKKRVAIVANHSSFIGNSHLVDSLLALNIKVVKIFCPEHGFRGDADAGEDIKNQKDKKTGLPLISLYGKHNKPQPAELKDVDIVVFDIQDVGVRFYTYISTLHYVMEACAQNKKPLIVLDRPNPNGYYIDGPVLQSKFKSFVGIHPVPIVYGMTIGEYALMINGEGWLDKSIKCDLKVINLVGYEHSDLYQLPIKPSPNLPNMPAVYMYPSLALFEGTVISVARGTGFPFQAIGHPDVKGPFSFTPVSTPGASKNPPYEGKECHGVDLREFGDIFIRNNRSLYLYWLIGMYQNYPEKANFFNNYFNSLAGNDQLMQQIKAGKSEEEIRKTWTEELETFKIIRKKYLLYTDF